MINWLSEKLLPKYKLNKKEQLILDIVTGMCEQSDTDIKMAPLTHRYYLVNKRLEYWVRLYDNGMTITNHKFTFSYNAPQAYQDLLVQKVVQAIEKSRDEFEKSVFENEVELLENIVANIKSK